MGYSSRYELEDHDCRRNLQDNYFKEPCHICGKKFLRKALRRHIELHDIIEDAQKLRRLGISKKKRSLETRDKASSGANMNICGVPAKRIKLEKDD